MRKLLQILFVLALIMPGCNEEPAEFARPDDLLEQDLYLDVLTEIELLKIYELRDKIPPGRVDSIYTRIFIEYDVDEPRYRRSHAFYQSQVDEQIIRIDTIINRLELQVNRIEQVQDSLESK